MQDKKKIDAMVTKIVHGTAGLKSRAVSTAPPRPAKAKAKPKAVAPNPPTPNENTVVGNDTKIPVPAKSKGRSGMVVNITFGKDC
jgi:hypothetical protein